MADRPDADVEAENGLRDALPNRQSALRFGLTVLLGVALVVVDNVFGVNPSNSWPVALLAGGLYWAVWFLIGRIWGPRVPADQSRAYGSEVP